MPRIDTSVEQAYYDLVHPHVAASMLRMSAREVIRQYSAIQARDERAIQSKVNIRKESATAARLNKYAASSAYAGFHVYGFHQPKNAAMYSTSDHTFGHMAPDQNPKQTGGTHGGIVQQGIV